MPVHRYFSDKKNAVDFANDRLAGGMPAKVLPPVGNVYEVEWSPVSAHVRKGKPVRASRRRVQKRLD